MFFGSRKLHRSQHGVSPPSEPASDGREQLLLRQWQAWRLSAQNVTRRWNEWLAAGSPERAHRYDSYVFALADEERAAISLARTISPDANMSDSVACAAPAGEHPTSG